MTLEMLKGKLLNDYGICRDLIGEKKRSVNAIASHGEHAKSIAIMCEIAQLEAQKKILLQVIDLLEEVVTTEIVGIEGGKNGINT